MPTKTLSVYPNPYIAVDHEGYPAGACPCDMPEHVGMTTRKWVGAELDIDQTQLLEQLSAEERLYRNPRQRTRFKFELGEPTSLPVTHYYIDRIRGGELIAANADTARLGGVEFVEPRKALAASKKAACAKWEAENGPGTKPEHIDALDQAPAVPKAAPKGDKQ